MYSETFYSNMGEKFYFGIDRVSDYTVHKIYIYENQLHITH